MGGDGDAMINLGAFGLVRLMREGAVSAREVTAAHVAHSEHVNPLINAIAVPRFAEAFAEAGRLDRAFIRGKPTGRLHGLPITVKECLRPLARNAVWRLTAACNHYRYEFGRAFRKRRIDLIACPPAAGTAPPHGRGASVSFGSAALFNLLGMPAGVVAIPGMEKSGEVPAGVQIVAPRWREDAVLRAMAAVELAATSMRAPVRPWRRSTGRTGSAPWGRPP
jgi:Asp-tRNA(Asn)/Glu-tRNA(Gln) amidotransferase A subunit family amidase